MLSDDTIENLVQVMVDRQSNINLYVLNIIIQRIKQVGHLTVTDLHRLDMLYQTGSDLNKINKYIAEQTGLQVRDIKRLIKEVAENHYMDLRYLYDYKNVTFIPFSENTALKAIVKAISNQTANTYLNLSNSTAFMMRDPANPNNLIPTSISQTYQNVLDKAIHTVSMGVDDYQSQMRGTINELIDSGIRNVQYNPKSGKVYTQRLDTAVRRNLLDGVRAVNQGVADETGKQYGADGKELSVHSNPAPDHAPVQGHQFTNEEYEKMNNKETFVDIQGRNYKPFDRAIGTLNCRHLAFSIVIGLSQPNYTDEQLKEILDKNEKGYTTPDGKHLTMYECTQKQRQLELKIKRAKEGQMLAMKADDMELAKQYRVNVIKYTKEYKDFSKDCGLSVKNSKIRVPGYKKISIN